MMSTGLLPDLVGNRPDPPKLSETGWSWVTSVKLSQLTPPEYVRCAVCGCVNQHPSNQACAYEQHHYTTCIAS